MTQITGGTLCIDTEENSKVYVVTRKDETAQECVVTYDYDMNPKYVSDYDSNESYPDDDIVVEVAYVESLDTVIQNNDEFDSYTTYSDVIEKQQTENISYITLYSLPISRLQIVE